MENFHVNQADDSDHEDHGSVVTYKDDEDDVRRSTLAEVKGNERQDTVSTAEKPLHPNDAPEMQQIVTPAEQTRKSAKMPRCLRFRMLVGDICDSNYWEACLVILNVAFVILTIAEVSVYSGMGIGTSVGLNGLSIVAAVLLAIFTFELILKTIAYDLGFWRVPRNIFESISILAAFPVQVATVYVLLNSNMSLTVGQLTIASRVFRLLVCILRQRRTREFYTAIQSLRALNDISLSNSERALNIIKEIREKYPLSDFHQVQLQWCTNIIASQKLYSMLPRGLNGQPLLFEGVDEDTSKWLLGTYSKANEEMPKNSSPPNVHKSEAMTRAGNVDAAGMSGDRAASPGVSVASPNIPWTDSKFGRQLTRRDTDGSDALLLGRRHTPLYLATEKSIQSPGAISGTEATGEGGTYSTQGANSPLLTQKRTASRASLMARAAETVGSGLKVSRASNLRRGSSFVNHGDAQTDLEAGNGAFSRIVTGGMAGLTPSDLELLELVTSKSDDVHPGFSALKECHERINRDLDEWSFDVFAFNEITNGRPLCATVLGCLRKGGLLDGLSAWIAPSTLLKFMVEIENGYSTSNPYHNRIHAADVVQCFQHFLTHGQYRDSLTPLDRFVGILAAAVHDFRHPGTNNMFLITTRDPLALQYNDIAVLENMHVASAFQLMRTRQELDIFADMPPAGRAEARESMIQMILATDMKAHFDILSQFKVQVAQASSLERTHDNLGAWWNEAFPVDRDHSFSSTSSAIAPITAYPIEFRRMVLKTGLHVADVSNPARPNALARRWADLVQEEFFSQGDLERQRGLPVSMFMDREKPAFPKMQVGFIEFIVKPLAEAFYGWLPSLKPVMEPHLLENLEYWKRRQEAESAGLSLPPPAPSATQGVDSKLSNRFVSRLKSGSVTRHRSAASLGDASLSMGAESPSLPSRSFVVIRRTTSDTFSPSDVQEVGTKRRSNPSPNTTPVSRSPIMKGDRSPPMEQLGDAKV